MQDGTIRLFMERETLQETYEKLPVFAEQLRVPASELMRIFTEDWLPYIWVVALPPGLRELDRRATTVRDRDSDDYPTAALAALLSPCILLTHDKDFGPLGIRERSQGVKAVLAVIDIKDGQIQLLGVAAVPAAPVVAVGGAVKWAADRVGPAAWVILGLLIAGVVVAYRRQPPEKRNAIKKVSGEVGHFLLEEVSQAASSVEQAYQLLGTYIVPAPEPRTPTATILRELAMASDSMSAQQLWDALDDSVRPAIGPLRAFLHANKTTVFDEARRGSFVLGKHSLIQ